MAPHNDVNSSTDDNEDKRIARPLHAFFNNGKEAFTNIQPHIIDQLKITRKDLFVQEVQGKNILFRWVGEDL